MPIFVLLLGRIIWKERQPLKIYLSVIPIIIGIAMATISELNFNMIGTIAAFASTIGFALQNLYTKKSLRDLNIHQHVLLQHLTFYGFFMLLTLWLFTDMPKIMDADHKNLSVHSIITLLFISGVCSLLQNLTAFSVMALVSTVSYSVASATKRVVVIAVSLLTLKNPVNAFNVGGMVMACCGVFLYNRVKTNLRKIPILPTFSSPSTRTA
ncbi:Oidioi.mRNA.OKI2018_I69.chr1.g3305.t1.cds [Oikopleura dioica]|uniref:Oidioi.mRNA.OKI2018_I69.chr1.g3305.t1.cds n=1 Tax=Oikopleura dioica TaxID=34765 RepID=A0ABN7SY19_OIKDI|nr:Oidioi.mRNA.OKI2018_I69.chr1.g3305.t1.cds [Oikopleura dioica]